MKGRREKNVIRKIDDETGEVLEFCADDGPDCASEYEESPSLAPKTRRGRRKASADTSPSFAPGRTPEERENQMISLAVNLAEKQLRDGTASSQVITHYLKLGSTKEKIEKEILEKQKELIAAKTASLQSAKRIEELYEKAMHVMRTYNGADDENV